MRFAEYAKAYVALLGAIAAGLQGVYTADTVVGQIAMVVTIVATAFATWRVPNAEVVNDPVEDHIYRDPDVDSPLF